MSEHTLRQVTVSDADIDEMAELLRVVFPEAEHFTSAALRWQYRDNPDGQVVGFNAWKEHVLAAHYVTIPLQARVHGRPERGLLSLNTATHPVHQGKGLFTKLAKATYEHAAAQGYGFVVGVANANSTHGFIKKLGFQLVSPLRAMMGFGPLPLSDGANGVAYEPLRSAASLQWRLAHPTYAYDLARSGSTRLLLSHRRQFGHTYVLQAERTTDQPPGIPVISAPVRKVWIGLDPAMRWNSTAYMNIPMRFRPSPLNLIFKDLTGQGRSLDANSVRFQAIDFDIL